MRAIACAASQLCPGPANNYDSDCADRCRLDALWDSMGLWGVGLPASMLASMDMLACCCQPANLRCSTQLGQLSVTKNTSPWTYWWSVYMQTLFFVGEDLAPGFHFWGFNKLHAWLLYVSSWYIQPTSRPNLLHSRRPSIEPKTESWSDLSTRGSWPARFTPFPLPSAPLSSPQESQPEARGLWAAALKLHPAPPNSSGSIPAGAEQRPLHDQA